NETLSQIEYLRRHFKREFEKELVILPDETISYDSCIDYCLPCAFGECSALHVSRCFECEQFYGFFD
ncbi:14388_t:CDS:1, partial [Gigaspora rosea]